jgi:hypothetical protein
MVPEGVPSFDYVEPFDPSKCRGWGEPVVKESFYAG